VTGSGFAPGEPVAVSLDTTPVAKSVLTADALGKISGRISVPLERWCALESGNAGSDFALGQASGDEEFWIQWVEGDSNNCQELWIKYEAPLTPCS
jgi:hypothetical protein